MNKKDSNQAKGHRNRLRQRFLKSGSEAFSQHELLELLLTFAIPRKDTKKISKDLLRAFGSLHDVLNASIEKLVMVHGVGETSAILIRLVRDFYKPSIYAAPNKRTAIKSTDAAVDLLRAEFATAMEEKFIAVFLDVNSKLLNISTLSVGTIDRAAVYPRKIAEEAIKIGAAAIILAHNHPRSIPEPSQADKLLTKQLFISLLPLGVEILDHVIIGENEYYSFAKSGLLRTLASINLNGLIDSRR